MKARLKSLPVARLLSVSGLVAVFVGGFLYLWNEVGGPTPEFGAGDGYQLSFSADDVRNLQERSDVSVAGVVVGHVADQTVQGDRTRVTVNLSPEVAPLHKGATVRIGLKSLIGQSYVHIEDGDGAPIPDGATLSGPAVKPTTDIEDVISTFDPDTRKALSGTLRSLGGATKGTSGDIDQLMSGLGDLGREGHTALDAIAAQSGDLQAVTREATTLLNALDTGRGQIVNVVRDARELTEATAGQRRALEDTMRRMPGLLGTAKTATGKLSELSGELAPVAADLRRAAPNLNEALLQLPDVSRDLRGMLPALNGALDAAPATLDRIPRFGNDVRTLVPGANLMLRDVNPMLSYLKPYGRDVGAMFANFGASMDVTVKNGVRPIRLAPIYNSGTVKGNPLPLNVDPTHWTNAYPAPGQAGSPAPFKGEYPRVERAPK